MTGPAASLCCLSVCWALLTLPLGQSASRKFGPPPKIIPGKTNVTVNVGDIATLPCTVQNLGTREVSWRRTGSDFFLTIGTMKWVQNINMEVLYKEWPVGITEWNLILKDARPQDAGSYECQIIHTDIIKWNVYLNVKEKPVYRPGKSPLLPGDEVISRDEERNAGGHWPAISLEGREFVESGDRIHLVCNSTEGSRVPEDVDWFKNGNKIHPDGRLSSSSSSSSSSISSHIVMTKFRAQESKALISELIIERARSSDSGTYICRSSLEQIASVEVTVLVAGSTNIKRGSGSSQTAGPQLRGENCAVTLTLILGHRCVVIVLVALTSLLNIFCVLT